jgi:hypothetical protein
MKQCKHCKKDLVNAHANRKFCDVSCKEKYRATTDTRIKYTIERSLLGKRKESSKKAYAKNPKKAHIATALWKSRNADAAYRIRRTAYLKKYYNMTLDKYEELLEKQNRSCAICKNVQEHFQKNLSVDHDHHTGEVRALLCYTCNRNLIGRHRDPTLLYAAAKYLEGPFTGVFVPERFQKSRKRRRNKR